MRLLRDYQLSFVDRIRNELKTYKRIVAVAPTGSGKTVTFASIATETAKRGFRVLITTHRREIHRQTIKKLYEVGVTCGQIISGAPMTKSYPIQVGMIGTLLNRMDKLEKPDLIISDECHHATSVSWRKVLLYWGDSVPVLGFTATPIRLDGKGLGQDGLFQSIVEGPTVKWLVKNGYLSYPLMYRHPNEITESFTIRGGDYDKEEQAVVFSKGTVLGDVLEHYKKYLDGRPTVAFCPTVEHSKITAKMFNDAGYRAIAVYGDMPDKDRDDAIAGLGDGRYQIITSCDVISEGMDVPGIEGVILLRRTLSVSLFLQQVGRGLRPVYAPGFDLGTVTGRLDSMSAGPKPHAIILDHAGNYKIHGSILAEREWSLDGMRRKDKKLAPKMTECPKCYAIWEGKVSLCRACGFEFPKIEVVKEDVKFNVIAGELIQEFPDLDEDMAFVTAKALQSDPGKKQKILMHEAYKLAVQGDAGKAKLDTLRKAMGYRDSYTKVVWDLVMKNNR